MFRTHIQPSARPQFPAHTSLASAALLALLLGQSALATDFVYQGQLQEHGEPVNGLRSISLQVFDRASAGQALSGVIELPLVKVENGAFEVPVQLPEDLLARDLLWLELAVSDASGQPVAFPQRQPASPKASLGTACWELGGNSDTSAASFLGTTTNQPLTLRVNNQAVAAYSRSAGATNVAMGEFSVILGGARGATISGGGSSDGNICGASGNQSCLNSISGANFGVVGGGRGHRVTAASGTIAGGESNTSSGFAASIGGGEINTASGDYAVVPGGLSNSASGDHSLAAGLLASAEGERSFIWNDGGPDAVLRTGRALRDREFKVLASNTIRLNDDSEVENGFADVVVGAYAGSDQDADLMLVSRGGRAGLMSVFDATGAMGFDVNLAAGAANGFQFTRSGAIPTTRFITTGANGAHLTAGGTWTNGSSEAFKEAFEAVDPGAILERVLALPLATWTYRNTDEGRHLGPTAEDFAAAFGLGSSPEHIATVDADGVALAAIQGLALQAAERETALEARIAALEARLAQVLGE